VVARAGTDSVSIAELMATLSYGPLRLPPRADRGHPDTAPDRLLAAADAYHAMTEPRPHRGPLGPGHASRELRAEVTGGRLDSEAAEAVLAAAGHRVPARRAWPGGLTAREVEVLGLLARGHSTRDIAQRLVVTPKTAANHIEHIYTKLGISSRAAATLYATQHGLVGTFEPAELAAGPPYRR
jgi:DNA-binding CsgD family transcriptional regulator